MSSTFTTFRAESKKFMDYDHRDVWGKLRFWLAYPVASAKWHYWMWRDTKRNARVPADV